MPVSHLFYAVQRNNSFAFSICFLLATYPLRSIVDQVLNNMEKVSNVKTESVPDLLAAANESGPVGAGEINASGHKQELERNFKLLALCGVAITTGNSWVAYGGTIVRLPSPSMHIDSWSLTWCRWLGYTMADHQD